MEPSENWDHLFGELGPPSFSLKWSYLPDKVVPIARMAKFCRTIETTLSDNWNHLVGQLEQPCRTIGTTLSDNWNHLVTQMKTLESRVKNQQSTVNSQQSTVNSQLSTLNTQHSKVNSQQSSVLVSTVKRQKIKDKSQDKSLR